MNEEFWGELSEGDIHFRDFSQFELKSEFFINPQLKHNSYKQEIYLFIPHSLQVNPESYSKAYFYGDETTLIRYKTPVMTLRELIDDQFALSPLTRIQQMLEQLSQAIHKEECIRDVSLRWPERESESSYLFFKKWPHFSFDFPFSQGIENKTFTQKGFFTFLSDEVKLFGAIFRSSIRQKIHEFVEMKEGCHPQVTLLLTEVEQVCEKFRFIQSEIEVKAKHPQLVRHFKYVDEFISIGIEELFTYFLKQYLEFKNQDVAIKEGLIELIFKEKKYRELKNLGPKTKKSHPFASESILYRQGLLNRFILESLTLKHVRFSSEEKHRNILGAVAAGLAMLVYMILFTWKASTLVINSLSFILFAAFFYVIKDRIKEGFKTLYTKRAHRWFADYSTEITNFKGFKVGKLTENFSFVHIRELSGEIAKIRNHHFHEELQALHRHETIIQYKREVSLNKPSPLNVDRRKSLTVIFRLNVDRFLQKASNAFQSHLNLKGHGAIIEEILPKVYHLNVIIRSSYLNEKRQEVCDVKTYRVVADKCGIKRVENLV